MSCYLAVDTATDAGSVAVGAPGEPYAAVAIGKRRHGTSLVPAIAEVLRLAGVEPRGLSGVVVADGPGSFTGLRIGFATVKGILLECDHLSLTTIPSLLAAVWGVLQIDPAPAAALYDALRGEVFGAVYGLEAGRVRIELEPCLGSIESLCERSPVRPWIALGDGAVRQREAVERWTGRAPLEHPIGMPQAAALLHLLDVAGAASRVDDVQRFEPAYGRQAEAQARWERNHGVPLASELAANKAPEVKPKQGSQ
ncbi:MAG: tRNA (adenosine(37)-N6)-threonylcarbamoyltransferase complex dimerization subunit type 1 TsaB [Gemmatimonadales bacterium]